MSRLGKYKYIIEASFISKHWVFYSQNLGLNIKIVAGLYKPTSLKFEHTLLLSALSNKLPVYRYQLHGKRQKRTVSLNNFLVSGNALAAIDKIVHELLPKVPDFSTPKIKRSRLNSYTFNLKQKFSPLADFEDLMSHSLYDDHRGIFLPLSINMFFDRPLAYNSKHFVTAHYLRMLRIPFNFYTKNKPPAFDDTAVFSSNF